MIKCRFGSTLHMEVYRVAKTRFCNLLIYSICAIIYGRKKLPNCICTVYVNVQF